jgi:energy-coupling factor transporter ATP-binding protein EcfA2
MSEYWDSAGGSQLAARAGLPEDRLPPHSVEAERGVLGCILLSPAECLGKVKERVGSNQVFFELNHAAVFEACCAIGAGDGSGVDLVTVGVWLRDKGKLEGIGGLVFLSSLPDGVPSAGNLDYYLEIVWEKFLARKGYRDFAELASQLFHQGAVSEPMLMEIRRRVESLEAEKLRHQGTPKFLKRPVDFQEGFFNQFFGRVGEGEPGWRLPIEFKLKIRPGETTLVTGDDGSGKSTVLDYFALHLMHEMGTSVPATGGRAQAAGPEEGKFGDSSPRPSPRGGEGDLRPAARSASRATARVCIASFEMPPVVTLWMLCAQLIGRKRVEDCHAHRQEVANAFAWLNSRLLLYDFLGIGDWRDVLNAFRFAAKEKGARVFILDSVMRIGIPDDDYAAQGLAAAAFAQFGKEFDAHLFFVIHENKGTAGGKAKIRGSKLWSANADNVLRVERNMKKGERVSEVDNDLRVAREMAAGAEDIKDLEEDLRKAHQAWDTHFVLQKQRYPGSQQNGSRHVWFDGGSFQFRERLTDAAGVNWLARWKGTSGAHAALAPGGHAQAAGPGEEARGFTEEPED